MSMDQSALNAPAWEPWAELPSESFLQQTTPKRRRTDETMGVEYAAYGFPEYIPSTLSSLESNHDGLVMGASMDDLIPQTTLGSGQWMDTTAFTGGGSDDIGMLLANNLMPSPSTQSLETTASESCLPEGDSNDPVREEATKSKRDRKGRPVLSSVVVDRLNNLTDVVLPEEVSDIIVQYTEGISFALGEGGRELLRACLNAKGCKGKELQGAAVPALLKLAHERDIWNVALRIRAERASGKYSPDHEAFIRFKASQSQQRKNVKKEYMRTERDPESGLIDNIVFDGRKKITLGKEGREILRQLLRQLHHQQPEEVDKKLEQYGFRYSELRNATVQQLVQMAHVCGLWTNVIKACREQEAARSRKKKKGDDSNDSEPSFSPERSPLNHKADPEEQSMSLTSLLAGNALAVDLNGVFGSSNELTYPYLGLDTDFDAHQDSVASYPYS